MEKIGWTRRDASVSVRKGHRGFPGGPVVKTPPSNAGDTGSCPGWGAKIPHAKGQHMQW